MERTTLVLLVACLFVLGTLVSARQVSSKVGRSRNAQHQHKTPARHLQRNAQPHVKHNVPTQNPKTQHLPAEGTRPVTAEETAPPKELQPGGHLQSTASRKSQEHKGRFFPDGAGIVYQANPNEKGESVEITVEDAVTCSLARLNLEAQLPYWNNDLANCNYDVFTYEQEALAAFEEETEVLANLRACLLALYNKDPWFVPGSRSAKTLGSIGSKRGTGFPIPEGSTDPLTIELFNFISNMSISTLVSYYTSCEQDVTNLNRRLAQLQSDSATCHNLANSLLQQISDRLANVQVFTYEIEACQGALNPPPTKNEQNLLARATPSEEPAGMTVAH